MSVCRCQTCHHMKGYRKPGNSRTSYRCCHPDQRYIRDYFNEHKIKKMPGFLGYGHGQLPLKRTVKWCPEEKKGDQQ